jgi:hypothetical protein
MCIGQSLSSRLWRHGHASCEREGAVLLQVHLTALGAKAQKCHSKEELLELFPDKDWDAPQLAGPAPTVGWCPLCKKTHELFLFPNTPAGYLAQVLASLACALMGLVCLAFVKPTSTLHGHCQSA